MKKSITKIITALLAISGFVFGDAILLLDMSGQPGTSVSQIVDRVSNTAAVPYRYTGTPLLSYGTGGGIQFEGSGASDTLLRYEDTSGIFSSGKAAGGKFRQVTVNMTLRMYNLTNSDEHDIARLANGQFYVYRDQDADGGEIRFSFAGRGVQADWVPTSGQEYDLQFVFNNSKSILFYVDGVLTKSDTNSAAIPAYVDINSLWAIGGYLRSNETTDRYDTSQVSNFEVYSSDISYDAASADILSCEPAGDDMMKLTIDAVPPLGRYQVIGNPDLVTGEWAFIPQSDDGTNALLQSTLHYSTLDGLSNAVIFVESTNTFGFYSIDIGWD